MTILEKLISQQGEDTAAHMVGLQLADIIDGNAAARDIVFTDLEGEGMGLDACAAKIKGYADAKHKKNGGNAVCVTPREAAGVICEFYGIQELIDNKQSVKKPSAPLNLADFM